ncbi:MAG TPA: autotransporter assembly complex family protein [Janthinobacterium sp.]|nr:autotransporter assembly complex family protein [Janthinobacterium sp.]
MGQAAPLLFLLATTALPAAAQVKSTGPPPESAAAADNTPVPAATANATIQYKVRIEAPAPLDTLLENNLDLVRYRGNTRVDREQLRRLVRGVPEQVKTLVATAGYYTPEVSARIDRSDATPTVVVTVTPGQPVVVGSVELVLQGFAAPRAQGGTPFDTNALKAGWGLKEGQIFRQGDWEAAKRKLLRDVVQTRYPRAQLIESQATVDPGNHRAALRVVLDSGPEMRFGALRIEGLKRYPASIVGNLNQIKPGDYYSEAALQSYQSRLQDTGYFSSVEVSADLSGVLGEQMNAAQEALPGAPGPAAPLTPEMMAPLPLVVRVTENKRRNISAGLGYSTNTGNRAQLTYDDLNVFGLKFKSALTMETLQQSARGDFYFPTTPDGYNDSVGGGFIHTDIAGENTSTTSVTAKRAWGTPLLERSLTLEFLSEKTTVAGDSTSALNERSKSLPLTYSLTSRKLDSLIFPTAGYVANATIGIAPLPILTDERFIRGSAKFVYYHPLGQNGVVVLRGEGGALVSKEKPGVPTVYLFRAGGDQSVRGYAYQELGVKIGDATVGGRYLATGSAEYQYWLTPTWGGAAFYDAGNAADTLKELHPKSGYGVGVRYKSPVGPINVDAAYGHADQKFRLHFSLGFTF